MLPGTQRNLRRVFLAGTMLFLAYAAYAGNVTISTFYPSPYGSYQQLDTTGATNLATAGGNVVMGMGGGNVGIGNNAPGQKLQVTGNILTSGNLQMSGASPTLVSTTNNPLIFSTNNAERMRILSTGNVGVGTNAPASPLHVDGTGGANIDFRVEGRMLTGDAVNNGGMWVNSGQTLFVGQSAANRLGFWNAGWRLEVLNNGDVGIGRNNPTQRLHVEGNILSSGTITANSDARFKTDLQPLAGILPKLNDLHAVSYQRSERHPSFSGQPEGQREIGLVGQELEKVFPELVLKNGPEEYRSVDYGRLSAVLLEAVKELEARVHELEARGQE